jgi:WhiB family transcriptional regulator, redox-sensing transcriptional regulator
MTATLESSVVGPPRWRDRAACAAPGIDPEVFFPEPGRRNGAAEAKRICARCPVRAPCLDEALATPPFLDDGIRAGTTHRQRRDLRQQQRRQRRQDR